DPSYSLGPSLLLFLLALLPGGLGGAVLFLLFLALLFLGSGDWSRDRAGTLSPSVGRALVLGLVAEPVVVGVGLYNGGGVEGGIVAGAKLDTDAGGRLSFGLHELVACGTGNVTHPILERHPRDVKTKAFARFDREAHAAGECVESAD